MLYFGSWNVTKWLFLFIDILKPKVNYCNIHLQFSKVQLVKRWMASGLLLQSFLRHVNIYDIQVFYINTLFWNFWNLSAVKCRPHYLRLCVLISEEPSKLLISYHESISLSALKACNAINSLRSLSPFMYQLCHYIIMCTFLHQYKFIMLKSITTHSEPSLLSWYGPSSFSFDSSSSVMLFPFWA